MALLPSSTDECDNSKSKSSILEIDISQCLWAYLVSNCVVEYLCVHCVV
jgi:hypothetical protein